MWGEAAKQDDWPEGRVVFPPKHKKQKVLTKAQRCRTKQVRRFKRQKKEKKIVKQEAVRGREKT